MDDKAWVAAPNRARDGPLEVRGYDHVWLKERDTLLGRLRIDIEFHGEFMPAAGKLPIHPLT